MTEDPFKGKQENLDIRIGIAKPEDWQDIRDLLLESTGGPDAEMFGITPGRAKTKIAEIRARTEEEWMMDLSSNNGFFLLLHKDSDAIGINLARKEVFYGSWYINTNYIKPEFRGNNLGKKMFAARLNEIKKRNGKKVTAGFNAINTTAIHIAELFGFKKSREDSYGNFEMELDLTDPEVVKKIDEVLNSK